MKRLLVDGADAVGLAVAATGAAVTTVERAFKSVVAVRGKTELSPLIGQVGIRGSSTLIASQLQHRAKV